MMSMTTIYIVLALCCGLASSIQIDVTNKYSDDIMQDSININCVVEKDENCEKTSITLQLSKGDDKRIVSIQGQNSIDYGRLQKSSVRVKGHIDEKDYSKSYLNVTIDHVVREDSGLYTCSIFYLDYSGHMKQEKASESVTVGNQTSEDLIKHVIAKVTSLESQVKPRQERMENNIAEIKSIQEEQAQTVSSKFDSLTSLRFSWNQTIEESLGTVISRIDRLEENENNQSQSMQNSVDEAFEEIQNLRKSVRDAQERSSIAFRAIYAPYEHQVGDTLRFTTVEMNIGEAYNPEDGMFTAPRSGLYVFHITITTLGKLDWTRVWLKSEADLLLSVHTSFNHRPLHFHPWIRDSEMGNLRDGGDQSTGSSVVYLQEGEKLWALIDGGRISMAYASNDTTLSGYLLKAVDLY